MKAFLIVVAGIIFFGALIGLMVELGKEKTDPDTGCVSWTDFTHYGDVELKPGMDCKLHRQGENLTEITCCPRRTP
jgi:hypothetical protein